MIDNLFLFHKFNWATGVDLLWSCRKRRWVGIHAVLENLYNL